jgi:hypothetical protein
MMDASLLRPLRIPEILDAGIKITTKRFAALAKLVAVVTIPIQVLSALVLLSTFSDDTRLIAGAYFGEEAHWRESLRYA